MQVLELTRAEVKMCASHIGVSLFSILSTGVFIANAGLSEGHFSGVHLGCLEVILPKPLPLGGGRQTDPRLSFCPEL